jgi:hypothetical protein
VEEEVVAVVPRESQIPKITMKTMTIMTIT